MRRFARVAVRVVVIVGALQVPVAPLHARQQPLNPYECQYVQATNTNWANQDYDGCMNDAPWWWFIFYSWGDYPCDRTRTQRLSQYDADEIACEQRWRDWCATQQNPPAYCYEPAPTATAALQFQVTRPPVLD